jgi:CRP/FNR family cyclic AMP-dependent transcriptional regulator
MEAVRLSHQLLANAGSSPISFAPGEVIFREGDKGDKMYVVRSGEVEIVLHGKVIETVARGGIFGEMALIDGSPRVATTRAKTKCEVSAITERSFLFLVDEMPYFALSVMRTLVDRLRRMDERVGSS